MKLLKSQQDRLCKSYRPCLILGLLALFCFAAPTQAANSGLAVLEFQGEDIGINNLQMLTIAARRGAEKAAQKDGSIEVFTRKHQIKAIRKKGGCAQRSQCDEAVFKKIGADFGVMGKVTKGQGGFRVAMDFYHVEKGRFVQQRELKGTKLLKLRDAVQKITAELILAGLQPDFDSELDLDVSGDRGRQGASKKITVNFTSEPGGASVMLDGAMLCPETPCTKRLYRGMSEVVMQLNQYRPGTVKRKLKDGETIHQKLRPKFALLSVKSEPAGLSVKINGKDQGKTPIAYLRLAPGRYKVVAVNSCVKKTSERIKLKEGDERDLVLTPKPVMARLKLSAVDEKGKAMKGVAYVDGEKLGPVPGRYEVGVCAQMLEVISQKSDATFEQTLQLKKGKLATIKAKLKASSEPPVRTTEEAEPTIKPVPKVCPKGMKLIESGTFRFGSAASDPMRNFGEKLISQRKTHAYCMDYYEYPNKSKGKPKVRVSWKDAKASCEARNKRLCTELEWERACKGPSSHRFPYGDDWEAGICNTESKEGVANALGAASDNKKCKSGFGIYSMSGNAEEWTADAYAKKSKNKVVKGGAANRADRASRCAARRAQNPKISASMLGFRCCAEPK